MKSIKVTKLIPISCLIEINRYNGCEGPCLVGLKDMVRPESLTESGPGMHKLSENGTQFSQPGHWNRGQKVDTDQEQQGAKPSHQITQPKHPAWIPVQSHCPLPLQRKLSGRVSLSKPHLQY